MNKCGHSRLFVVTEFDCRFISEVSANKYDFICTMCENVDTSGTNVWKCLICSNL